MGGLVVGGLGENGVIHGRAGLCMASEPPCRKQKGPAMGPRLIKTDFIRQ